MQTQEEHRRIARDRNGVSYLTDLFHFPYELQFCFFSCSVFYHFAENTSTHKEEKSKSSYGISSVECITVSACGYDLMFYSEVMLLLAKSHQHTFIAVLLSVF